MGARQPSLLPWEKDDRDMSGGGKLLAWDGVADEGVAGAAGVGTKREAGVNERGQIMPMLLTAEEGMKSKRATWDDGVVAGSKPAIAKKMTASRGGAKCREGPGLDEEAEKAQMKIEEEEGKEEAIEAEGSVSEGDSVDADEVGRWNVLKDLREEEVSMREEANAMRLLAQSEHVNITGAANAPAKRNG